LHAAATAIQRFSDFSDSKIHINMKSFLYPLFESMAIASEGIWMWIAIDSSYFINKTYIFISLKDMLGSAKLNWMAGHSAIYGD
jgi:hypothetical protein